MHWRYLKAVLRHKKFVFLAGRGRVSLWRLLIHDWTKFLPCEWLPYARSFYGPTYPTGEWCNTIGVPFVGRNPLTKERVRADFRRAWLHHQKFNLHHWQYWIMHEDTGKVFCLPMPDAYREEMLADWRGANRAYGDMPLTVWYEKTKGARMLHPDTLAWIEQELYH